MLFGDVVMMECRMIELEESVVDTVKSLLEHERVWERK